MPRPKALACAIATIAMLITLALCPTAFAKEPSLDEPEQLLMTMSAPDPNPPALRSISVDRQYAGVGDTVTFSYEIDEPDGIASVSPGFVVGDYEPGRVALVRMSGTTSPAAPSSFRITITSESREGTWRLGCVTVRDEAGYSTTIYDERYAAAAGLGDDAATADLSAGTFEVDYGYVSPKYEVISGDEATYVAGSSSSLTFRFDGPFDLFQSLSLDGMELASTDYEVSSGSTVITLKPALLATLALGKHRLVAYYSDGGSAEATFTITEAGHADPEDDGNNPAEQPSHPVMPPTTAPTTDFRGGYGVAPFNVPMRDYVHPYATQWTTGRSEEQASSQPSPEGQHPTSDMGSQTSVTNPGSAVAYTPTPSTSAQAPIASTPVATSPVQTTNVQVSTAPSAVTAVSALVPATADSSPSLMPRVLALTGALALCVALLRQLRVTPKMTDR